MSVDRDRLRGAVRQGKARIREHHIEEFDRTHLAEATVCSVDPSLTATAWSVLRHDEQALVLLDFDTVRWKTGVDGVDRMMDAGDALFEQLCRTFRVIKREHEGIEVVVEAPPIGQIRSKGSDSHSPWLAHRAARDAALAVGLVLRSSMPIPTHKKLITGNRAAQKDETKLCLELLATALPIVGYPKTTNDNVRDSVSIGIADLRRRVQA